MQVNPAVFNLMVVFFGVAVIALVAQAIALVFIARGAKEIRDQMHELRPKALAVLDSADQALKDSRRELTEISAKTNKILDSAALQMDRTDEFLTDATERARSQLDRVELVLDDSITRVHETVMQLNNGVLQPIRKVGGFFAGVRTALGYFAGGSRPDVSQATSDEEMFI